MEVEREAGSGTATRDAGDPRLEHKMVGDYHVFTSPDLPALYVAHHDREQALSLVPVHLEALKGSDERRAARMRARQVVAAE